jgi:hypothetical protein
MYNKLLGIISVSFNVDQHSSDTGEKMGVQWDSILAIHRLQEIL